MQHALPLLIDTAMAARDQQSAALGQAQQAVQQARATLQRLREFRAECLARSAAGTLGKATSQSLQDYQQFVARLDEAISMQLQLVSERESLATAQQVKLMRCQQRLLAFETLSKRDKQQQLMREQRRDQHTCDEFAARASARAAPGHPQ